MYAYIFLFIYSIYDDWWWLGIYSVKNDIGIIYDVYNLYIFFVLVVHIAAQIINPLDMT